MPFQHSPRETPVPKNSVKFNSGRDRYIAPKTSHYSSTGNAERIYFNNIFSSEKIRRDASNYKFETIEQFCGDNSLQNGNSSDSIEPTSRRRFSSECGSKRCVLQYSNTSAASQISEIPLEKSKVRVPVPTFRSKICTTDFHKMYKTNYVCPEVSWSSGDHLHRRFSLDGKECPVSGGDRFFSSEYVSTSRVSDQRGEIFASSNSVTYLSWLCHRYSEDGSFITAGKYNRFSKKFRIFSYKHIRKFDL